MCEECHEPVWGDHAHAWAYCGTCVVVNKRTVPKVHVECFPDHALCHELQGQCYAYDYPLGAVGYHGIPSDWDQEKWLGKRRTEDQRAQPKKEEVDSNDR
jgi:hypothetical protein